MATYASPFALKWSILVINSLNFILALAIICRAIIELITRNSIINNNDSDEDENYIDNLYDRYPSIGSSAVKLLLGIITINVAIIGSVASNLERPPLLDVHGYFGIISFIIKLLFIFASLRMHMKNYDYNPINLVSAKVFIGIGIMETISSMFALHYAKVVKRGDAALPTIQKLPM